ncbi:MAG: hypothetical protein NTU49_07110, partial [Gammaproteobacteria bacterium]|nr:hypothetical protein [Gammaproteobacteria bacterium]
MHNFFLYECSRNSSLSSAAVVGTATIVGPLVCCAAVCGAISVEHNKDVGNMLALSAVAGLAAGLICLPVTAVTGAAMTKIAGAGLGYAAASGGIGLGVLGISAVVGTVAIMCVGGSCFALVHAARKITGNRFGFTSEQAIADSRAYNEPTAELSAVPVDVVDGKITAVH